MCWPNFSNKKKEEVSVNIFGDFPQNYTDLTGIEEW
jgi:hypothetical protein